MSDPEPLPAYLQAIVAYTIRSVLGGEAERAYRDHPDRRREIVEHAADNMTRLYGTKVAAHWRTLALELTQHLGSDAITADFNRARQTDGDGHA